MRRSIWLLLLLIIGPAAACSIDGHYVAADAGSDAMPPDSDASLDSGPDAAAGPRPYDIAYIDHFRLTGISAPESFDYVGFHVVVNPGDGPIDPSTFEIVGFEDDHKTAAVSFSIYSEIENHALQPGQASGGLTIPAMIHLLNGLVPEERVDTDLNYLALRIEEMPTGEYVINTSVTVRIQGTELTLSMLIEHRDGSHETTVVSARRLSAAEASL